MNGLMTAGKMKDLLRNIPDNVAINVLNKDGKSTANIEFWFEDLETRQFVELTGHKPFYETEQDELNKVIESDEYCWTCGRKKELCVHK